MAIEALPENTTRALGSSLVLNDAKSVVKELVDNALDARASAISIEIANNTLDIIQVKDNGTGIGIQDRQLLCKRGCTSKIRNLDDLSRLGGFFLGFRGEALSSIAELSRDVVVTTRVDGEVVATSLKYATTGMLSSSSASHPVGTTVRVHEFLTNIPVRRQTALKTTSKTLQAIKSLLFAFAFARPDVRFSLKVLKGKNEKLNWTYAASRNDSQTEVAAKIVGNEVAAECTECKVFSSDVDDQFEIGWEIQALLVAANADLSKVRNGPQFVSVDGRPVSMDRGTMKEIAKAYKHHLQRHFSDSQHTSISRPFISMQIRCPSESYDVNVEPAKDEVLFFKPSSLILLIETLFQKTYQDNVQTLEISKRVPATESSHKDMYHIDLNDIETLESIIPDTPALQASEPEEQAAAVKNPFTIAAMNKIISPKKMGEDGKTKLAVASPMQHSTQESTQNGTPTVTNTHRIPLAQATLPSPIASDTDSMPYQNPGPPMKAWVKAAKRDVDEETGSPASREDSHDTSPERTSLQNWLTPEPRQRQPLGQRVESSMNAEAGLLPGPRPHPRATNLSVDSGPTLHASSSSAGLQRGPGQKPFKSPIKRYTHGHPQIPSGLPSPASPVDVASRITGADPREPLFHAQQHRLNQSSVLDAELAGIMDFERRKKAAIARHRKLATKSSSMSIEEMLSRPGQRDDISTTASNSDDQHSIEDFESRSGSCSGSNAEQSRPMTRLHHIRDIAGERELPHAHPPPSATPHRTQSTKANHSTDEELLDQQSDRPQLSDDDPRTYLIKQRRLRAGNSKLYRVKSSKLPFENLSPDATTLNLAITTDTFEDLTKLQLNIQNLAHIDRYVKSRGTSYEDLLLYDMTIDDNCAAALREVVKARYRYKDPNGEARVPHLKITISKETIPQDHELSDV